MSEPLTKEERHSLQKYLASIPKHVIYGPHNVQSVIEGYEATMQDLEQQLALTALERDAAHGPHTYSRHPMLGGEDEFCHACSYAGHLVDKEDCPIYHIKDLEQQLAGEKQQHKIMDAAYWAAKGREAEQTAALDALEAKLAEATRLLAKVHGLDCRFCGQLIRLGHNSNCEYAAFLADPSQAAEQYRASNQPLFQLGEFLLHSGQKSHWKIECDAAKDGDWEAWAAMIAERQTFSEVVGVPRGGLKLALALTRYKIPGDFPVLVVDDVLTTGESILQTLDNLKNAVGWVVFARGDCPAGVQALFQMPTAQHRQALKVVERVHDHYAACLALEALADAEETITRSELIALLRRLLGDIY